MTMNIQLSEYEYVGVIYVGLHLHQTGLVVKSKRTLCGKSTVSY